MPQGHSWAAMDPIPTPPSDLLVLKSRYSFLACSDMECWRRADQNLGMEMSNPVPLVSLEALQAFTQQLVERFAPVIIILF